MSTLTLATIKEITIGRTRRGPVNKATTLFNFSDYERTFGTVRSESSMGYRVRQYFLNDGKTAVIVRVHRTDGETTTQTDINSGIVNLEVGFAPLKPAEFVFLKIQQLAGQVEA